MLGDALTFIRAVQRPPLYYLGRLLGRGKSPLHESADATEILYSGGKVRAVPFFFWTPHLDRIRDSISSRLTADKIRDSFHRKCFELHPLRICRFSDAFLINGSVYLHGAGRMELRTIYEKRSWINNKSLFPTSAVVELSDAVLGSGIAGSSWFGHWLRDELTLQMLARSYGPIISHVRPLYPHELPYLKSLGLDPPRQLHSAHFQSLIVIDEFAQNPDKVRRFLSIRKLLSSGVRNNERLYIRRGKSGTPREIRNEPQLCARLVAEGYGVVDLERCTFDEMHEACRQARVIVGIEGSHLSHAYFMAADHACLVILCAPCQVHITMAEVAPCCRLSAAMFVCLPENADGTRYTVDVEEVLAFIEDAERLSAHHAARIDAFIGDVLAHR